MIGPPITWNTAYSNNDATISPITPKVPLIPLFFLSRGWFSYLLVCEYVCVCVGLAVFAIHLFLANETSVSVANKAENKKR